LHVPQFWSSYAGSTHVPPQSSAKLGHWQLPATQDFPPEHVVPQPPQFELFVWRLTQAPPQLLVPCAQLAVHVPPLHTSMPTHPCPHVPQLVGLDEVSMQVPPPQSILPCGQVQAPSAGPASPFTLVQVLPPEHGWLQPLQLSESVVGSMHVPPQSICPLGHVQLPVQTLPPLQVVPQPPQLKGSTAVSTHTPLPQSTLPWGH
jgi:hypothetical protein